MKPPVEGPPTSKRGLVVALSASSAKLPAVAVLVLAVGGGTLWVLIQYLHVYIIT
jgi:hypothetical protein